MSVMFYSLDKHSGPQTLPSAPRSSYMHSQEGPPQNIPTSFAQMNGNASS